MTDCDTTGRCASGLQDIALEQTARDLQADAMARAAATGVAWLRNVLSRNQAV